LSDRQIEFPGDGVDDGEIRLRLLRDDDRPALVSALQGPEFGQWTRIPHPYAAEDADAWLVKQAEARHEGTGLHVAIADAGDDRLLGEVGLTEIEWTEQRANVGYWVARENRRRGVATGAVRLLARWAFDALPLARLAILVDVRNPSSAGVAEHAGFTREGVLRSYMTIKDTRRDVISYSLLPAELWGEPPAPSAVR
jgi:[ribosomal protein S5]-alanine N-acetyltransferase